MKTKTPLVHKFTGEPVDIKRETLNYLETKRQRHPEPFDFDQYCYENFIISEEQYKNLAARAIQNS